MHYYVYDWVHFYFMCVSHSNHGQPPSDEPGLADPHWHLSLQHVAGRELHPALTWCLQLYRLAPHNHFGLCVHSCQQ